MRHRAGEEQNVDDPLATPESTRGLLMGQKNSHS